MGAPTQKAHKDRAGPRQLHPTVSLLRRLVGTPSTSCKVRKNLHFGRPDFQAANRTLDRDSMESDRVDLIETLKLEGDNCAAYVPNNHSVVAGSWKVEFNSTKNAPEIAFQEVTGSPQKKQLTVTNNQGWLRLYLPFNKEAWTQLPDLQISVEFTLVGESESTSVRLKIYGGKRHWKDSELFSSANLAPFFASVGRATVRHPGGISVGDDGGSLAFEFTGPSFTILLGDIQIAHDLSPLVPESASKSPPLAQLSGKRYVDLDELNRDYFKSIKKDEAGFLIRNAELARRLELPQTAMGIVKYLVASDLVGAPESLEGLARLVEWVTHVEQDDETLRAFLVKYPLRGAQVWTRCFGTRSAPQIGQARLSCLYSNLEYSDIDDGFVDYVQSMDDDPRLHLILANLFRRVDSSACISAWNRFLASYDVDKLRAVGAIDSNFLDGLRFTTPKQILLPEKVSVIMAAFNAEKTIAYSIESILAQSYKNFELLICDDLSTDRTAEILRFYAKDPRVRVFRSEQNQGPYQIRNNLVEKATGEYITFQDADDVSIPSRLHRQISTLTNEQTDICVGKWVRVAADGRAAFFPDGQVARIAIVSIMFRLHALKRLMPYPATLVGGDTVLYEAARAQLGDSAISQIQEPLLLGLLAPSSLTGQDGLEASEKGGLSLKRRKFVEAFSRRRLLGDHAITREELEDVLVTNGLYRAKSTVIEEVGQTP